MSSWMHISAVLRFDGCQSRDPDTVPNLGNTAIDSDKYSYKDWQKLVQECTVPYGSEGSIRHSLWENPNKDYKAAFTGTFWGDLRDRGEEYIPEVLSYFNNLVAEWYKTDYGTIRSGILEISVPTKTVFYTYNDDENFILVKEYT